jgi:hypothetical protein
VAIIGDARNLGFADKDARSILAESEVPGRVATGVVISSPVVRVLANLYATQVGRRRPFRVFDSEQEAISWGAAQVLQSSAHQA